MPTADQISNCARILMAVTATWKASDGNTSTLADAREMLAQLIYATGGKGFSGPAAEDAIKQPAMQDTWKACVVAARAALDENGIPREPFGPYVVFWVADPANSAKLGTDLGLNWPLQPNSHIARVSGPIAEGNDPKPKRLFFFDTINEATAIEMDADAGPGFWPRAATRSEDTKAVGLQQGAIGSANPAKRPYLATGLFVLWVLSGVILSVWLWQTGDTMRSAVSTFRQTSQECKLPTSEEAKLLPADQKKPVWNAGCDDKWSKAWNVSISDSNVDTKTPDMQHSKAKDWISHIRNAIAGYLWPLGSNAHLSLFMPFILTMGSILLLMLAAGLATKGLWFGVLIDDRNRISMSRTQQVAWTTLLIAAMAIMGWFNAAGISLIDQSAQSAWDLFPYMPGALWAALGINLVATPYLSDVILDRKDPQRTAALRDPQSPDGASDPTAPPGLMVRQFVQPARLDINGSSSEASWTDLITGETKGSERELDVSRIQHLVISGTLLTSYFMSLAAAVGDISGESIMKAIAANMSIFTNMPGVGTTTFLGLLGVSHAGYLVFKANSAEGDANAKAAPTK
jgi:hypothetical protein